MTSPPAAPSSTSRWYRQVSADQWNAFAAAYLGSLLDGFDFTILTFLLVDIQKSFTVNNALAGALLTVSLLFRVIGGVSAGTAADPATHSRSSPPPPWACSARETSA